MPEWRTLLFRPLWCRAIPGSLSRTTTSSDGSASSRARAVASPTIPAPMTATSARSIDRFCCNRDAVPDVGDRMSTLAARIERASARGAITFVNGRTHERVPWAELHEEARGMAAGLQALGVGPGAHVGILG